jgi:hypothetical protein
MMLSTTEGAAKIPSAHIAGMNEEPDPTVAAARRAMPQSRMTPKDRVQRDLVLSNKRVDAVVLVPVLAKRKMFREGYNKTAKFSVIILNCLCISSSYSLDAKASRGRAGILYATTRKISQHDRVTDPSRTCGLHLQVGAASPLLVDFLARLPGKERLLGKEAVALILSFQVVGQFI